MLRTCLLAFLLGFTLNVNAQGKPQYGGTLEVGNVFVTLNALSWDPGEWPWKLNVDTGMFYEQLFAGDLDKSVRRGGKHKFQADAWLPSDAIRGELAERWEWKGNSLTVTLRKGIMFPEKPGVMKARELTAEDVVSSYERLDKSPKKLLAYFDHISTVRASDARTVVFHFKDYFAEWDYRFGWGYYSAIAPKELSSVDAKNWKNGVGTGPFQIVDYVQGNSHTYAKNPNYWDSDRIGGSAYKLPFVDKVVLRIIRDEATQHSSLRTGKLDILEAIRWSAVDNLKQTAPQLKWSRRLSTLGQFLAMRIDQKPFDDIRVRRALNYAVNKQEIVKSYYGGNAELFAYPMHLDYIGYYEPLEKMPASVRELFTYDPAKAKKLLAEAGYPNGFTFKAQVNAASPDHMDLAPLVAGYLEKVGVKMELQPLEYGAFLGSMMKRSHGPGYFMNNGHTNPTTTIRKSFMTGQAWNPSGWSDPAYDKKIEEVYRTRDEAKRQQMLKELTVEILDKAPYVWLPIPYVYTAWWPWVQNYDGELRVGAERAGPIYARVWIDQEMKKKMGF
jgi:peptide/nickel transport system substrate-binding protein